MCTLFVDMNILNGPGHHMLSHCEVASDSGVANIDRGTNRADAGIDVLDIHNITCATLLDPGIDVRPSPYWFHFVA